MTDEKDEKYLDARDVMVKTVALKMHLSSADNLKIYEGEDRDPLWYLYDNDNNHNVLC